MLTRTDKPNIVLIGFMGSGKSVVGEKLAKRLGYKFIDIDTTIEKRVKKSIKEIFDSEGEEVFREIESQVVAEVCSEEKAVISCGGGVVLRSKNIENLKRKGFIFYLKANIETLFSRAIQTGSRPLLMVKNPKEEFEKIFSQRKEMYDQAADKVIQVDSLTEEEVVAEIIKTYNIPNNIAKHMVSVKLNSHSYDILIGTNILSELGDAIRNTLPCKRSVIITNPTVEKLFGSLVQDALVRANIHCNFIEVPDGEEYKNLEVATSIFRELIRLKAYRYDPIIALGGGVIGDLAGFVASTYMRGVPLVQVPTTLLAQVDSSVGGKVAVNLPEGKNLVGCFYQPNLVFTDVHVLKELPDEHFRAGLAEVIKYGFIIDADFLSFIEAHLKEILQRDEDVLIKIVKHSCKMKAQIVEMDEKDRGIRAILNYGHTIGHALEALSKYKKYLHGEAISIGMVGAAIIAVELGMLGKVDIERHKQILSQAGLPISVVGLLADEIVLQMKRDKKFFGEENRFVLLEKIGKAKIHNQVSWDLVRSCLRVLGAQ